MSRILFVDDEPKVLEGLRRMLRGMRQQWEMAFCPGGAQALECLQQREFDVVVTDMRMPGMDGAELLEAVLVHHPATARVVLSGQCDRETVLNTVGPAHQFLTKPCDSETVKRTLQRIGGLRARLPDPWHRQMVSRLRSLPSPPTTYLRLKAELEADRPSPEEVARLLSGDPASAAKIAQLVSSSFFGTPQRVSDVGRAAGLLGLETLKAMARCPGVFRPFAEPPAARAVESLVAHVCRVAAVARHIAQIDTRDPLLVGEIGLAGLLHDLGLWVLADAQPEHFARLLAAAQAEGISPWEAERREGLATHADLGGYLLGLWGLSDVIVESAAFHHTPSQSTGLADDALAIVHVANAMVEAVETGRPPEQADLDQEFLARAGKLQCLRQWREAAECALGTEAAA